MEGIRSNLILLYFLSKKTLRDERVIFDECRALLKGEWEYLLWWFIPFLPVSFVTLHLFYFSLFHLSFPQICPISDVFVPVHSILMSNINNVFQTGRLRFRWLSAESPSISIYWTKKKRERIKNSGKKKPSAKCKTSEIFESRSTSSLVHSVFMRCMKRDCLPKTVLPPCRWTLWELLYISWKIEM